MPPAPRTPGERTKRTRSFAEGGAFGGSNTFRCVHNGVDGASSSSVHTLWMSEAAMLEYRIPVGTLVSVCIPAEEAKLEVLCNNDCVSQRSKLGGLLAIATVWPSKKVVKNGVRVSKQLAQALNSPIVGSALLINALHAKCSSTDIQKQIQAPACEGKRNAVVQECSKLFLDFCDGFVPAQEQRLVDADASPAYSTPVKHSPGSNSSFSPSSMSKLKTGGTPRSEQKPANSSAEDVPKLAKSYLGRSSGKMREVFEKFAARWLYGRLLLPGNVVVVPVCGMECGFHVTAAEPAEQTSKQYEGHEDAISRKMEQLGLEALVQVFYVTHRTTVSVSTPPAQEATQEHLLSLYRSSQPLSRLYSSVGGLSEAIAVLKEIVEHSLLHPERLVSFGLKQIKGVLLYGPPGTGKTTLAQAVAHEAGVEMFVINGPEVVSEYYGESEAAMKDVFASASKDSPSVIFIDEVDAITPQRKEGNEELGQRMMATLLALMDSLRSKVLVIAATNRPECIDSALRRHGRFDHELEIGVPTPKGRLEILEVHLRAMKHSLAGEDIRTLAATTHGFVGADLSALCNEAALGALRRFVASGSNKDELCVNAQDIESARSKIRPSAMREVMLEVPKVRWSDIGGQHSVKQQLKELVEWPQKHHESFERIGTTPPRGVLLYGPPGCSKTLLARAVAAEAGLNFIAVKGPELFSKWVGESEKAVRAVFARAKAAAPSVVFFDEIDGLAVPRSSDGISVEDRVMSQLLTELDGVTPRTGVSIIAATNRPDKLDNALLRPGRFDRVVYVGPPDKEAREDIFRVHLRQTPLSGEVSMCELASRTEGYTGADVAAVCREAALAALEEDMDTQCLRESHFDIALSRTLPSQYDIDKTVFSKFLRG